MKKIISIILSVAMLVTVTAGIDFSAYAAYITGIEFEPTEDCFTYEDCHAYDVTEDGRTYKYYQYNEWDLMWEGYKIIVNYSDSSKEVFTCGDIHEEEDWFELGYKSDRGNILDVGSDLSVDTHQSPDNVWEVNNTYPVDLIYKNGSSEYSVSYNVSIIPNPVDSISVSSERDIVLFENVCGNWEKDENDNDYFRYWTNESYFHYAGVQITVNFSDGTTKTYSYTKDNWKPVDGEGNEINDDWLEYNFLQGRDHYTVGSENRAYFGYYGKEDYFNVTVAKGGDVDEGELNIDETVQSLYYSDEKHTYTFTPDHDGAYRFDDSLIDRIVYDGEFSYSMTCGEENVDCISEDPLLFSLEGGKTYEFTVMNNRDDEMRIEYLCVRETAAVSSFTYTPANGNSVYAGDVATDDFIYNEGNKISLTLSNGESEVFTVNENSDYVCESGERIEDYCRNRGIENMDCRPHCIPNYSPWETNKESYITIEIANAKTRFDVNVTESDIKSISYETAEPLEVYEGTSRTEDYWDEYGRHEYEYYDFSKWDLERNDNAITVTYLDNTSETFSLKWIHDEGEWEDYPVYISDEGNKIFTKDLYLLFEQDYEHQWSAGNSYPITVMYHGKSDTVNVSVAANPVESISAELEENIKLYEGFFCDEEYDEENDEHWYNYWWNNDFLKFSNPTITVNFVSGDSVVYHCEDDHWVPVDEDGNEINERFFDFRFDNQHDKHYTVGTDNAAVISYYGKTCEVPVEVIASDTVNEGELQLDKDHRGLYFPSPVHVFTFTPAESGAYVLDNSLSDRLRWDSYDYEYTLYCEEDGEFLEPLNGGELSFMLTADKTYTLKVRRYNGGTGIEYLTLRKTVGITDFDFIYRPSNGVITVFDGDYSDDALLYRKGNKLVVTFTDGTQKTYTCYSESGTGLYNNPDEWYYADDEGNRLNELLDEIDAVGEHRPYGYPSDEPWDINKEASYTIGFGGIEKSYPVTVEPSPVDSIEVTLANDVKVYEGTAEHVGMPYNGAWREYMRYNVDPWLVLSEGTKVKVNWVDGEPTTYVCRWVEEYDDLVMVSETDEEDVEFIPQFVVRDNQSPDNEWEVGQNYTVNFSYIGADVDLPVSVVPSPIESVSVSLASPVTLFRNCNGETRYDGETDSEFFEYRSDRNYLRKADPVIKVKPVNGDEISYTFRGYSWVPVDEDGNELNDRYFDFRFEQYGTPEKNETPEAYVYYFGKRAEVPVQVEDKHDVDDGAITMFEMSRVLFISDEQHTLTFTPERSGAYILEESLIHQVIENHGDYDFSVTYNGAELESIKDDRFIYNLEAGKTYTVNVRCDNTPRLEMISVYPFVYVSDIKFTPAEAISVNEGDIHGEDLIYRLGNTLKVTLSNGDEKTFTATDGGWRYMNSEGLDIYDWLRDENIDDPELECQPSSDPWTYGGDAYITVKIGEAQTTCPVTVSQSTVNSISYTPAKPLELTDSLVWNFEENGENRCEINDLIFRAGDVLTVNYKNGSTVNYTYKNDTEFENENDPDDVITPWVTYNDRVHYKAGDTVNIDVHYQTGSAPITATVIECPVQSVAYTPANPFVFEKETDGEWRSRTVHNDETDEYETENFFCYNGKDLFEEGSKFEITYKEGGTKTYISDGNNFICGEDILDNGHINALWGRDQYERPYVEGYNNIIYVGYMAVQCPVKVAVVDSSWTMLAEAIVNHKTIADGETVSVEPDTKLFFCFNTGDDNMAHGVAPLVGFSDGYDEGTLKAAGFTTQTGNAADLGYGGYNEGTFGLEVSTENLTPGTEGTLYYYLYELPENFSFDSFDFVNTPHVLEKSLKIRVIDHEWEESEKVAATCTAQGYTVYTCKNCGKTYTDYSDALGHDWVKGNTVAPTCTAAGYTNYSCSRCEATKTGDAVAALGHNHVQTDLVAPTCTKQGYTVYTCTRCTDSYKGDFVPVKGHSWDEGKVTKAATYTEAGVKTFTCKSCGATKTEAIPKLNKLNNPMTVKAVKKTYTVAEVTKKAKKFKGVSVKNAKGTVTYSAKAANAKSKKVLKFDKKGNITVKKGTKRGTYKAKITVKAKGTTAYKPLTKVVSVKIVVR